MWCLDVDARGLRGEVCWLEREGDDRDVKSATNYMKKKQQQKTTENVKNYYCKEIKLFFVAPSIP